jgi:hypothetical protein
MEPGVMLEIKKHPKSLPNRLKALIEPKAFNEYPIFHTAKI